MRWSKLKWLSGQVNAAFWICEWVNTALDEHCNSNDISFLSIGQTDLPNDAMEATLKTITLPEDFTDFETQLPDLKYCVYLQHSITALQTHLFWCTSVFMTYLAFYVSPRTIDVVDHFSLNQCRTEDITLKENFGNHFLNIEGIGINSELSIKQSSFYIVYAKPFMSLYLFRRGGNPVLSRIVWSEFQRPWRLLWWRGNGCWPHRWVHHT